jgi:hypothetical protein
MTEPADATQIADYTFTKPEGLLAHYTKAAYVFEDILPSGTLRLSPYRLMRDPIENKDILPSIAWSGDPPDADRAIQQVYTELKAARDRMRVLSFTHDADNRSEYSGFDCCWARPRMWEQYGDFHRGACCCSIGPDSSAQFTTRGRASACICATSTTAERASPRAEDRFAP